jgi:hypothetical protein
MPTRSNPYLAAFVFTASVRLRILGELDIVEHIVH